MISLFFAAHLVWRLLGTGSVAKWAILTIRASTAISITMLVVAAAVNEKEQPLLQQTLLSGAYTLAVLSVNMSLEVVLQAYRRFVILSIGQVWALSLENLRRTMSSPKFRRLFFLVVLCYVLSPVQYVLDEEDIPDIFPLLTQSVSYFIRTSVVYCVSSKLWYCQSIWGTPLIALFFAYNFSTQSRGGYIHRMSHYWLSSLHPAARSATCAILAVIIAEVIVLFEDFVNKISTAEHFHKPLKEGQGISADLWVQIIGGDEENGKYIPDFHDGICKKALSDSKLRNAEQNLGLGSLHDLQEKRICNCKTKNYHVEN